MNAPPIMPVDDHGAARQLAQDCGASVSIDANGPQLLPHGASASPDTVMRGWVSPIGDLGLLRIDGDDAVRFLHSQLTNDLEHLAVGALQLAGYCSAKGRLLATMLCWREDDAVLLLTAQPLLAGLRKRLSMFVLRAKVRIVDVSGERFFFGLGGTHAPEALAGIGCEWPAPMSTRHCGGLTLLGLPPLPADPADVVPAASVIARPFQPLPRALLLGPASETSRLWNVLSTHLSPAPSWLWRWTEVRTGTPRIVAAGLERFVPQMVNLDLIGGVSFSKGCYPGQEIVARSHYLGKLKRRMFLASIDGDPPEPGTDVLRADSAEPCGVVVMSAPTPGGGAHLLFESQISAATQARLSDGRVLVSVELPYPLAA